MAGAGAMAGGWWLWRWLVRCVAVRCVANVKAVKTSRRYATCIWMPRRSKRYEEEEYVLNRGRYNKAFNLEELYRTVIAASIMIRENSMAIQLEH